jgi:peptidoglycan hydrolase CwlO-like protein
MNVEKVTATVQELQERMVTKMDANLKEMRADQEHLKKKVSDLKTQIGCHTSHTDVNQEKAEACHQEMKACRERQRTQYTPSDPS